MKTPGQRGPFGAWLVEQRKRLSQERGHRVLAQHVVDELIASGYPIDAAYYRALEGGSKRPGQQTREALARYFGQEPPLTVNGEQDVASLVAAIRDQTASMNRLVSLMETAAGGLPALIELARRVADDAEQARDEQQNDATSDGPVGRAPALR